MKRILFLLVGFCSLVFSLSFAGDTTNPHTGELQKITDFQEEDGSLVVYAPETIKVSNGTLTDNGDGTASLNTSGSGSISDTAYAASWDGVTTIAPSKNAVYDKIEIIGWSRTAPYIYPTTITDNIGIGLTNPIYKLDVSGNSRFAGDILVNGDLVVNNSLTGDIGIDGNLGVGVTAPINRFQVGTTPSALLLVVKDTGNIGIGTTSPFGLLEVGTYPSATLFVSTLGNIGIGKTLPIYKLDVNGTANFSGAVTGIALNEIESLTTDKSFSNGNNSVAFNFVAPSGQPTFDGAFEIQASGAFTGHLLHVHQHTGNPGATHLTHLEAEDADVQPLCVIGVGATNATFSGGNVGIGYTVPIGLLQVGTSPSAPGLIVMNGGNVGIGTTNPDCLLKIKSSSPIASNNIIRILNSENKSIFTVIDTGTIFNDYDNIKLGNSAGGFGTGVNNIAIGTSSLSQSADSDLNIGIGYFSGSQSIGSSELFINNQDRTNYSGDQTKSIIYGLMASDETTQKLLLNAKVGIGVYNTNPVGILQVGTLPNSALTVLASGSVGIGTTNPGEVLHLYKPASVPVNFRMESVDGQSLTQYMFSGADYWRFRHSANNLFDISYNGTQETGITINTNGNVGIGLTNPIAKFEISTAIMRAISNTIDFTDVTDGYVLTFDTATNTWAGEAAGAGSQTPWTQNIEGAGYTLTNTGNIGIGTSTPLGLLMVGTSPSPQLVVMTTGNVGIGKTNPATPLDVNGIITATSGTSTDWNTAYTHSQDNTQAHSDYLLNNANDSTSGIITAAGYYSTGNVGIGNTAPQRLLDVSTTPGTGLIVTTAGNVGIGKTNPTYKLDINGTMRTVDTKPITMLIINCDTGTYPEFPLSITETTIVDKVEARATSGSMSFELRSVDATGTTPIATLTAGTATTALLTLTPGVTVPPTSRLTLDIHTTTPRARITIFKRQN